MCLLHRQPSTSKSTADMDAVRAWFMAIDLDRSGELNSGELQRALSMGQLNFSLTDVDSMIRAFDTNGRRKLNIEVLDTIRRRKPNVEVCEWVITDIDYMICNVESMIWDLDTNVRRKLIIEVCEWVSEGKRGLNIEATVSQPEGSGCSSEQSDRYLGSKCQWAGMAAWCIVPRR
eukprot:942026-Pelagomonas_calceolata.AAC.3